MELPKRKQNRLTEYAYNTPGAYFITICTKNRKNLFWEYSNTESTSLQDVRLSKYGLLVDLAITRIPENYPAFSVKKYVIMPNHIHLLLQICTDCSGRPMVAPTVMHVIQQMKGIVTKQVGYTIWQKGFYDHVIRTEEDYREIWNYIEGNPMKWAEDRLFMGSD